MLSTLNTGHDFPGWHFILPLAVTALGTCLLVAGMCSVVVTLLVFGVDILCPPAFVSLRLEQQVTPASDSPWPEPGENDESRD